MNRPGIVRLFDSLKTDIGALRPSHMALMGKTVVVWVMEDRDNISAPCQARRVVAPATLLDHR